MHELSNDADAAVPASARPIVHEVSSGGVVLRHIRGAWQVALIEPNIINADTVTRRAKARPEGTVFALPKGGVDEGETPEQSADREVYEETGVRGIRLFRLTTIRYVYIRSWGGREQVSKSVSFYLYLYASGRLGQIRADMRDEVRKAFWFPLDKAHRKLTYRGEREVLKLAQKIVREEPERLTPPPPEHSSGPNVPRPVAQQREVWVPRAASSQRTQPAHSQPRNGDGSASRPQNSRPQQGSAPSGRNNGQPQGGQPRSGNSSRDARPSRNFRGPRNNGQRQERRPELRPGDSTRTVEAPRDNSPRNGNQTPPPTRGESQPRNGQPVPPREAQAPREGKRRRRRRSRRGPRRES